MSDIEQQSPTGPVEAFEERSPGDGGESLGSSGRDISVEMETGEIVSQVIPEPSHIGLFVFIKALTLIFVAIFVVDMIPLAVAVPLLLIVYLSLSKKLRSKFQRAIFKVFVILRLRKDVLPSNGNLVGKKVYDQARRASLLTGEVLSGSGVILPRACLVMLVWLLLNTCVPRLRKLTLLGSPLWKWSFLGVTVTCSYFVAAVLYLLFPILFQVLALSLKGEVLRLICLDPEVNDNIRGYMTKGLWTSGTLVMYCSIVLGSWVLYFRTELVIGIKHPEAFDYVTWTCVSLFIGSLLLLLKDILLLKWSAGAVYRRFQPRILIAGVKFCFLCLLDGDFGNRFINPLKLGNILEISETVGPAKHIMSRKVELSHLVRVGAMLTSLVQVVALLDDDGASHVVQWFDNQAKNPEGEEQVDSEKRIFGEFNKQLLSGVLENESPMKNLFECLVLEEVASDDFKKSPRRAFTLEELKKWMADGHNECVNMGRTLADARAIVSRLDIFLSCIILGATVLLGLLITGIATTTVLVTIATPLLALTFVFGDTAKAFFQGLIFCFATHPFDVGDRCLLDETELEVKRMSILTTTFVKIGTNEKRLYPNSVLASKAIVNLGWQPDPTDVVEFTLNPSINITQFEARIVKYFDDNNSLYKASRKVMFKEAGDNFTVSIYFTHILTVSDLTHSQCLEKKREQRSHFVREIKQYLIDARTTATTTNDRNTTLISEISESVEQHPGSSN